uniref:Uncharacterized protein n=1 Tax=Meloidogyne incognita TaxID=6306 RepID=A0A914MBQ0_MELIC
MPTDAYNFVKALDRIIIACSEEKIFDEFNLNKELCFEEIITDFYDISLILFRNEEGKLGFKLIKKLKSENKINSFFIPINSLLWIRRIFAKIFEEFDGGSQKLKELFVDLKNFESKEFIKQIDVINQKEGTTLASDELKLGENNKIKIELREGVSGNRTVQIKNVYRLQNNANHGWRYLYLPKLLLPDAFNFVKALDKIIIACDGERVFDPSKGTTLASDELKLGENNKIKIELREGVSGNRTIQIKNVYRLQNNANNEWRYLYLPKLLLPDAFNFVKALDKIIIACDGERVFDPSNANKKLVFEEINTDIYDISLNLFRNERGFLVFQVLQKKKTENGELLKKERLTSISLQINSLLWIREIIAKMIEEFDGSKTLLKLPVVNFPFIIYQQEVEETQDGSAKFRFGGKRFVSKQGKSGKRTINLVRMFRTENTEWEITTLNKFLVPNDAYNFVKALDRIIIACNEEKNFDEFNLNKELCFEEIITDFYDISLILFRNEEGKLGFKLIKKLKSENKINSFFIPINSLLWIRRIFAKIFEEFDGGSQKLKELPNIAFPFMDI